MPTHASTHCRYVYCSGVFLKLEIYFSNCVVAVGNDEFFNEEEIAPD